MANAAEVDLTKIAIRAKDKEGNWGSFTLQELLDQDLADEVYEWFIGKLEELLDVKEGEPLQSHSLQNMIAMLETLGFTIVKMK